MPVIRALVGALVVVILSSCAAEASRPQPVIPVGGDPDLGRETIVEYGCGSCHRIPGIPEADALVGPPLESWSGRAFVAGILPNSPENLARFLADPDEIRPGTAMPDLQLNDEDIAAIVAYLFTLE